MSVKQKSVAEAATYLDGFFPGWENKIKIPQLSMFNVSRCILGQLYGTFWDAPMIQPFIRTFSDSDGIELKDYEYSWAFGYDWNTLGKQTLKWIKEIEKRRELAQVEVDSILVKANSIKAVFENDPGDWTVCGRREVDDGVIFLCWAPDKETAERLAENVFELQDAIKRAKATIPFSTPPIEFV